MVIDMFAESYELRSCGGIPSNLPGALPGISGGRCSTYGLMGITTTRAFPTTGKTMGSLCCADAIHLLAR